MRAGTLRHRIAIKRITAVTRSPQGADVPTWSTIATVWGEIKPLTPLEMWSADQAQAKVNTTITLRYTDVTEKDTLLHGSTLYQITGVMDVDTRNRTVTVSAVKK